LVNEYDVERIRLRLDAEAFVLELHSRSLLEEPPGK